MENRTGDPTGPGAHTFGTWIAALRKKTGFEQDELASQAGVSTDQLGRIERGENVGLWYVAAVVSVLYPLAGVETVERTLMPALNIDGKAIIQSGVLTKRLKAVAQKKPRPDRTVSTRRGRR